MSETRPAVDINVEFGGVSIGESTCRLGVRIARSVLNLLAADECFCGHRLTGKVILGHRDDQQGQGKLIDDTDYEVEGSFDVKRIGVNADTIATGLTFSLADIDVADIAKFSKGTGRLVVYEIGELPVDAPDEHDDDDAGIPPGTLRSEGPWRDVPITKLFDGGLLKSLTEAGLTTLGKLSDYTASEKRLTDIPGVGPGKASKIEDVTLAYWRDNPQHAEPATA
jgi:hypothetical protein